VLAGLKSLPEPGVLQDAVGGVFAEYLVGDYKGGLGLMAPFLVLAAAIAIVPGLLKEPYNFVMKALYHA